MRPHHAVGGLVDAEVAVLGVAAQAGVKILFAVMADHE
jgi:hypothetical protein